jgi:hypothetical protein
VASRRRFESTLNWVITAFSRQIFHYGSKYLSPLRSIFGHSTRRKRFDMPRRNQRDQRPVVVRPGPSEVPGSGPRSGIENRDEGGGTEEGLRDG